MAMTEFLRCPLCGMSRPVKNYDPSEWPVEIKVVEKKVGGPAGGSEIIAEYPAGEELLNTIKERMLKLLPVVGVKLKEVSKAYMADVDQRAENMTIEIEDALDENREDWDIKDDSLAVLEFGLDRLIEDYKALKADLEEE